MASNQVIKEVVSLLFQSPLANKPEPMPGKTMIDVINATASVYTHTLSDLDDSLLRAAVMQHMASSKWFPGVNEIREAALSLVNRADDVPDAFTAWSQVKRALTTRNPDVMHPLAQKAIDALGGLREFGQSDLGDESSWRARFIQAYTTYQQRQAEDTMMLPAVRDYIAERKQLGGQSIAGMISDVAGKMKGE